MKGYFARKIDEGSGCFLYFQIGFIPDFSVQITDIKTIIIVLQNVNPCGYYC